MFLQPDGTIWVQFLNFIVFFGLLNLVFLRPVGAAIRKRRAYINSVTADYDRYRAQAADVRSQSEAARAAARRDAEQRLSKARADISNETAKLSTQYAEQVAGEVARAHERVRAEAQTARADEDSRVRELANLMLDRTLVEAAP